MAAPTASPIVPSGQSCAGCGKVIDTDNCPASGHLREPRLTIPGVLARFAGKLKRLDFRITRTFVQLLRRPGELIRDYVRGRRAPYTNPWATLF
ncbi:MAG: DUF3667 domain-containing protein [Longimicrobiales bacterium]